MINKIRNLMDKVLFSSEDVNWLTPREIWEAAEEVFNGIIYLDPCSPKEPSVRAMLHYTEEDDGLSKVWLNSVFVNPPYARYKRTNICELWITKALQSVRDQITKEVILLLPARTDTQWFQKIVELPICFVEGRLNFIPEDKRYKSPEYLSKLKAPFPSLVTYIGPNDDKFIQVFQKFGPVFRKTEILKESGLKIGKIRSE